MSKPQEPNSFIQKSHQVFMCLSVLVLSNLSILSVGASAETLLGRLDQRPTTTDVGNRPVEPGSQPSGQKCQIYDANGLRQAYRDKYLYSPIEIERPASFRVPSSSKRPDREANLREAITLDPTDTGSYYELAGLLRIGNRYAEAAVVLQQLIQKEPSEYFPYRGLGEVLAEQGQIEAAIAALHEALERVPAQAYSEDREPPEQRIYINIGDLLQVQGKEAEALKSYQQGMIGKFPAFSSITGVLGYRRDGTTDYQQQVDPQQSERIYRSLIESAPTFPFGYYRLVELLKSQGRYDEAIAVYKTWLPLNNNPEPGNDGAFNDRPESYLFELRRGHARYLSAQKDFDAAVELYRTLIEEGDFYITDLQFELSRTLVEKGDLQAAASEYQRLIQKASEEYDRLHSVTQDAEGRRYSVSFRPFLDYGALTVALGDLFLCQGEIASAVSAYEKATSIIGSETLGYHALGNISVTQEDLSAAAIAYQKVLETHQLYETEMVSPEFFNQYSALVKQQQWEDAISLYRQSLQISDPTAE